MLFRNRSRAETPAESPAREPSELEFAKDTIAVVLRTLGEFCLPTTDFPPAAYVKRCEDLARELLVRRGGDADQAESKTPRAPGEVHREVRATVREQRRAESRDYAAHRETARVVVEDLVRQMRQALRAREEGFAEVLGQLDALQRAVEEGDLEVIRDTTRGAVEGIRRVIESQSERDRARLAELEKSMHEMKGELEEVRAEVKLDGLTGLLNRKAGEEALNRAIAEAQIARRPIAVFLLDIDHFKRVNDTWGHPVGDEVIKKVARVLAMSFPRRDDVVARWGGEEFFVLCRDVHREDVRNLGERAREGVELVRILVGDEAIRPTVSVGFAELRYEGRETELPSQLVARADAALYEAKGAGRNCVRG